MYYWMNTKKYKTVQVFVLLYPHFIPSVAVFGCLDSNIEIKYMSPCHMCIPVIFSGKKHLKKQGTQHKDCTSRWIFFLLKMPIIRVCPLARSEQCLAMLARSQSFPRSPRPTQWRCHTLFAPCSFDRPTSSKKTPPATQRPSLSGTWRPPVPSATRKREWKLQCNRWAPPTPCGAMCV